MTETPAASAAPQGLSNRLANDRVARVGALLVRLTVAALWLENLNWKKPPGFGEADQSGLWYFTNLAVEYPVFPPFSSLVENVIQPNFQLFAWGAYLTEICLAVFLLLGLATRFWATVGIAQAIVIYLSVGNGPTEWPWSYFLMIAAHVAILAFAAGRVFGVDAKLRTSSLADSPNRLVRWFMLTT